MPVAAVFPGQGAAVPGAGRDWFDHPAWSVVTDAETATGRPLGRLLLEADAEELSTTRASQLAVLLASLIAWEALRDEIGESVAFAGHSLGQITALLAAGVVDRDDGFRLAAERADRSQDSADANPGRMAALVGASIEQANELAAAVEEVWVANDNAPGQIVIAGTPAGVEAATTRAGELGVRRVMPLDVGHAFHTPLLGDAAEALTPTLEAMTWRAPVAPVVTNTDAVAHQGPEGWPERLRRHLVEPVRWRESQLTLVALGATAFVEVGPGKVLAGLAKRTVPEIPVVNVARPDDVEVAADALAAGARR